MDSAKCATQGVEGIALILKAHLLGKNPLDIEGNLRVLREFANHGRMGGGYSAVDMALHDISGKVYGVPAYRLFGNKNRDRVRIYADTTSHPDPKVYAERMRKRRESGLTFKTGELGARDRAIIVLGFAGAFRRSELVGPGNRGTGLQALQAIKRNHI
jgi:L-alanine-DL-glutamate epimerase-like enolase superfamily enzyme